MKAGPRFDFGAFVTWLDVTGIRYLLIGGHAVRAYGSPRFTADFDYWFESSARVSVLDHLVEVYELELSAAIEDRGRPIVIGYGERDKVDCFFARGMSTPDGNHLDFDAVFGRSVVLSGERPPPVRVPSIDDLIELKRLRRDPKPKDLEDIAFLRVRKHVEELGE